MALAPTESLPVASHPVRGQHGRNACRRHYLAAPGSDGGRVKHHHHRQKRGHDKISAILHAKLDEAGTENPFSWLSV